MRCSRNCTSSYVYMYVWVMQIGLLDISRAFSTHFFDVAFSVNNIEIVQLRANDVSDEG